MDCKKYPKSLIQERHRRIWILRQFFRDIIRILEIRNKIVNPNQQFNLIYPFYYIYHSIGF